MGINKMISTDNITRQATLKAPHFCANNF